jgi:putative Mn2+ efflux pump MntP
MLEIALVAVALGVSNLAGALAIGLGGIDRRTRLRVALVFGVFEAITPVVGLLIGRRVAEGLTNAHWLGGAALIAVGVLTAIVATGPGPAGVPAAARSAGLVTTAAALSVDNLVAGFGLGNTTVPLPAAVATITAVSVTLTLVGLELGERIGTAFARRGELLSGLLLIGVGVAVGLGALG